MVGASPRGRCGSTACPYNLHGCFFKVGAVETRADNYTSEGDLEIVCFVPATVTAATIDLIVRTDYETATLHEGTFTGVAKA